MLNMVALHLISKNYQGNLLEKPKKRKGPPGLFTDTLGMDQRNPRGPFHFPPFVALRVFNFDFRAFARFFKRSAAISAFDRWLGMALFWLGFVLAGPGPGRALLLDARCTREMRRFMPMIYPIRSKASANSR